MPAIDLEVIGLTQEALQERVVDRICAQLLDGQATSDYDEEHSDLPPWRAELDELVRKRIDEKVEEMASREMFPKVDEIIENLVLQRTNEWGEKRRERVTFIEYLVQRAETYLREKVTFDGKPPDGYGRPTQERIAFMVDQNLHFSIERAMKQALETANNAITQGIAETVKMKLEEIVKGLTLTVKTK